MRFDEVCGSYRVLIGLLRDRYVSSYGVRVEILYGCRCLYESQYKVGDMWPKLED